MFDDGNMSSGGHPYRQPAAPAPHLIGAFAAAASGSRTLRILALLLVVLCVWIGMIGWSEHRLNTAVAALPVAAQQAAYRRAYDDLSTTCALRPQLTEHCRAQAEFILRFPQCGVDCHALARHFLSDARR